MAKKTKKKKTTKKAARKGSKSDLLETFRCLANIQFPPGHEFHGYPTGQKKEGQILPSKSLRGEWRRGNLKVTIPAGKKFDSARDMMQQAETLEAQYKAFCAANPCPSKQENPAAHALWKAKAKKMRSPAHSAFEQSIKLTLHILENE